MDWSNDLIMEFLDLFHNEPIIWNPAHKKHKDRNDVNEAWDRIRASLSADVTQEELKKKKDSLMATYRKLSSKVTKSNIRASKGIGDVLKPEWFAFDKMQSFLQQIYSPRITVVSQALQNDTAAKTEDTASNDNDEPNTNTPQAPSEEPSTSSTKKRKIHHKSTEIEKPPTQELLRDPTRQPAQDHDECSLYVALLGKKLRTLDDHNREIAMFQINNIMYHLKQQQLFNSRWSAAGIPQYSSEFSSSHPFPHPSTGFSSHSSQPQPSSRSFPLIQLSSQLSPGPGLPSSSQIYSSSSSSPSP